MIELGKFLISTAVLGGLLVWLFKELFKMRFSRDLEKYKGEIDNYFYKEKLRFSRLYEERAIVIKDLYIRLKRYNESLKKNLSDIEKLSEVDWDQKNENIDKTLSIANEFGEYYLQNRILLEKAICEKIDKLEASQFDSLKKIMISHLLASDMPSDKSLEDKVQEALEYEQKLKVIIENDIPAIESELEQDFRDILGVIG